jgi:nitrogen fixation-related uncharacterized protein
MRMILIPVELMVAALGVVCQHPSLKNGRDGMMRR